MFHVAFLVDRSKSMGERSDSLCLEDGSYKPCRKAKYVEAVDLVYEVLGRIVEERGLVSVEVYVFPSRIPGVRVEKLVSRMVSSVYSLKSMREFMLLEKPSGSTLLVSSMLEVLERVRRGTPVVVVTDAKDVVREKVRVRDVAEKLRERSCRLLVTIVGDEYSRELVRELAIEGVPYVHFDTASLTLRSLRERLVNYVARKVME